VSLDVLVTGLDSGLAKSLLEDCGVDTEKLGSDFEWLLVSDGGTFSESLGEGNITEMEDGRDDSEDSQLLILGDTANFHGNLGVVELLRVVHGWNAGATGMVQVVVLLWWEQDEVVLLVGIGTSNELVEDVEGSLALSLVDDSGLLEQVDLKTGSRNQTGVVELKSNEFTETGRVVVLVCLGVTESLEHGIQLHKLVLECGLTTSNGSASTSDIGNVLDDLLCVFSLTSTGLTSNQKRLVDTIVQHGTVSAIRNGEHVGSNLISSSSTVDVDHEVRVNGNLLVGIDHHTEKTGVCVDDVTLVSLSQVVEHCGFTQVGKFSTILNTVELWGVHLVNLGFLELQLISLVCADGGDTASSAEDFSGDETEFFVRSPGHLLATEARDLETGVSGVLAVLIIISLCGLLAWTSESHYE